MAISIEKLIENFRNNILLLEKIPEDLKPNADFLKEIEEINKKADSFRTAKVLDDGINAITTKLFERLIIEFYFNLLKKHKNNVKERPKTEENLAHYRTWIENNIGVKLPSLSKFTANHDVHHRPTYSACNAVINGWQWKSKGRDDYKDCDTEPFYKEEVTIVQLAYTALNKQSTGSETESSDPLATSNFLKSFEEFKKTEITPEKLKTTPPHPAPFVRPPPPRLVQSAPQNASVDPIALPSSNREHKQEGSSATNPNRLKKKLNPSFMPPVNQRKPKGDQDISTKKNEKLRHETSEPEVQDTSSSSAAGNTDSPKRQKSSFWQFSAKQCLPESTALPSSSPSSSSNSSSAPLDRTAPFNYLAPH